VPLPEDKSDLLIKLKKSYEKLDSEFENLEKSISRKRHIQGGVSACDILAYQIGWGQLLLSWEKCESSGKNPDMPAKGFKWNELGRLANSFYSSHKNKSIEVLRREFKNTVYQVSAMIERLTDEELFETKQRRWTGKKWAMVKWIQINTIAPYSSARTKVRRWKKTLV
jgi:hypothetical protein